MVDVLPRREIIGESAARSRRYAFLAHDRYKQGCEVATDADDASFRNAWADNRLAVEALCARKHRNRAVELLLGYAFCWQRYAIGTNQPLVYQKALNGARYDSDVARQSLNLVLKTIKAGKQPRRAIKGQQVFLWVMFADYLSADCNLVTTSSTRL